MGSGASSIPMNIDKETFRRLSGGTINDAIFDANSVDGVMKRDRLLELAQMRDCFLSHDEGLDSTGRNITEVVTKINQALKGKGLLTWMDEKGTGNNLAQQVGTGIDKCRSFVCFLTTGYMDKVTKNDITGHASVEFNYTLRRKHPDHMIPVVLDAALLNQSKWTGSCRMALGNRSLIDFSNFDHFDEKIEHLYQSVIKISKAAQNLFAPENAISNSVLSQTNKPKEEQQFFQWLARSTNIEESKRIIYCSTLVKSGVSTVFGLAKVMKENPRFLPTMGVTEQDADQIALAIGDLGLGYTPIKDFNHSSNLDTVVFALSKASKSPDDSKIAEAALSCTAKVAASHPAMPSLMRDASIPQAILKLMVRHLAHGPAMMYACIAVSNMTEHNPDISVLFGTIQGCDIIPRTLRSHLNDLNVAYHACHAISILALIHENRVAFCTTGACEVVVQAMQKCMKDAKVVEMTCVAALHLGTNHLENVSKLGVAGVCQILPIVMNEHPDKESVALQVFRLVNMCSVESGNRAQLGVLASCKALVLTLQLNLENPEVMASGCIAMVNVLLGSAHNRKTIAIAGACEVIRDILQKHYMNPIVGGPVCSAIFSLIAGNIDNKNKFQGMLPLVQNIQNNPNMSEIARKDAKEAALRL